MSLFQSMDAQEVRFWKAYLEVIERLEAIGKLRRAGLAQPEDDYEEDRLLNEANKLHVQLWSSQRPTSTLAEATPTT